MLELFAAAVQCSLYIGVLLASGGVLAAATLRVSDSIARSLARAVRFGALLTILATVLSVAVLVLRLGSDVDASILSAVFMSNVGAAAVLRISGSLLLLVTPGSQDDAFGRGMHVTAAALVVTSFAFSGHAAVEGFGSGLIAGLHVAVAAWWVGSLLVLRDACSHATAHVTELVRRFSSIAVSMIAGLVVAGGVLVVVLVDFAAIEFTAYIRNLVIKIAIAGCVLGLAAYNKFALTQRVIAGDRVAIGALLKAINVELALIAIVLIATAVLTTFSSPHE